MIPASRSLPGRRWRAAAIAVLLGLLNACAGGFAGLGSDEPPPPRATGGMSEQSQGGAATPDATAADAEGAVGTATYRLNPQDVLRIFVWGEEELQREVVVQPDGSISFPLVGQIVAAGRTVEEVQSEIVERLDRFIPDAVATVELLEATGSKIYVMGAVAQPGEYPLTAPLTIVQAISRAGGFTEYAATDRIRVLRGGEGEEETFTVDYDRIAAGRGHADNIGLEAGDTIIVPEGLSFF